MIVDCAAYVGGRRIEVDPDPESLRRWMSGRTSAEDGWADERGEGFVWLGLHVAREEELGRACEALGFQDISTSEVLAPHTRPVLTVDHPTVQLVLRTARYDDREETVRLGEMTLLVSPHAIVTIRHGNATPLSAVRARLEADPERLDLGPMSVLTAVLEQAVRDYWPALDGFENDVVEAEADVFSTTRRQPVERLYRLKREVRRVLVAVDALQDPLTRLIRVLRGRIHEDLVADLNEVADELDRAVTRVNSLSGLLDAALTASLTQITVQQNDDMRKISAWVAMAAIPTMIAGIYGMNFDHMPELSWPVGYPAVLVLMAVAVAWLYRFFKRSGWL